MGNVIIIGSGPAGISAALYTARAGIDTTVLTKGIGALKKAEKIENYYGFSEPVTGEQLEEAGIQGAKNVGVKFKKEEVLDLGFGEKLQVSTTEGTYTADCVVLATGSPRAVPRIPGFKTFDGKGISYCAICDAFFYRGKNVVVLGEGEYALHEAETLLQVAASVTILTNGKVPLVEFPETMKVLTGEIAEITGDQKVESVVMKDGTVLVIDGIFVAYGSAGSVELAKKIGAEIDKNKILVDENMKTNVPGLYAAGDCTGGLLQVSKAVYEGAKAGTEIAKELRKR